MLETLRKLHSDIKGSMTPFIAILLILMILVGAYRFSLMLVYRDRTIVRDALDAAVTSALAGAASEKWIETYYYEALVCTQSHEESYEDEDGNTVTYTVCDLWEWMPFETASKNYVHLNRGLAESIARDYFEKNMKFNKKNFKIKKFNFNYEYDKGRYITVESDRENTSAPYSWWFSEFGDSSPGSLGAVDSKSVRFPRWVKVYIDVDVEVSIPMGAMLGRKTMNIKWDASAVKELKRVMD